MALCLLVGWTALAAPTSPVSRVRSMAALAFAVAIALGVSAFQLMPTLEYVQQSDRSGALPLAEVTTWSLQRISLLQLLLPRSVPSGAEFNPDSVLLEAITPWIRSIYLGIVPLCFAIVGVFTGHERRFWTAVALAAIVLAFGSAMPLLPVLYWLAPIVIGKFRYPEKFYFLVHFAAAVLAAEGAQRYFDGIAAASGSWSPAQPFLPWSAAWSSRVLTAGRLSDARSLPKRRRRADDEVCSARGDVGGTSDAEPTCSRLLPRHLRASSGVDLSEPVMRLLTVLLIAVDLASVAHGLNHSISWSTLQSTNPIVDVDALQSSLQRIFLDEPTSASRAELEQRTVVVRTVASVRAGGEQFRGGGRAVVENHAVQHSDGAWIGDVERGGCDRC